MNGHGAPELGGFLDMAMDAWFSKFHGPMPGRVVTYDYTKQVADVEPLVMVYIHGTLKKLAILRGVPVRWPGGGGFAITFPLQAGDPVGIEPQGVDASGWIASGSAGQPPTTQKRWSLSGVFCVPGGRSLANPLPSSCVHATCPVISGNPLLLGDATAEKLVALDGDAVHKTNVPADALQQWMALVETAINGLAPGSIPSWNLSTTFTQVGLIQSTATKVKAK